MASIEERLKLKRGQVDTWSTKEKLCLASCVLKCGNQNWMSVSRNLKVFAGEPGRPPDWFSQKSCAVQYDCLLDRVETPKRKKRGVDGTKSEGSDISPGESIVKQLVAERIEEVKKLMAEVKVMYLKNKQELSLVESGLADDRLNEFTQQIQEEKKQKEREQEAHQKWLKEREERKQEMEYAWRPFASPQHIRGTCGGTPGSQSATPGSQNQAEAGRRPRNESEVSEPDSNVESPLSVEIGGEETIEVNTAPTPTSPLLTSLLKSPSQAQSSSILHSAITSQRGASPTITSLLNSSPSIPNNSGSSSPNIKALVSNALANRAEEGPKVICHTASGSPTLSMLLELPPSVPGQPLPELPSSNATTTTTSSAASNIVASSVVTSVAAMSTPVASAHAEAVPVTTIETSTVSQPGDAKTDPLPEISAMDIMMPVETEANIAEAEKGLNIETADLQHLSHADLELVMDPIDMVLGEGDISLVEEMAVLIEVSSDEVGNSVSSVLDMNSKDAMAVAAQAQRLQAEAEQIQAASSASSPGVVPQITSSTVQASSPSPQQSAPISVAKEGGTPKKSRPVACKINVEAESEDAIVSTCTEIPKQESVDELTELSEIVDTYVEPKPEDIMRTVGLSKEALENASIVIIQDDGEVVKMPDVVEEKEEEKLVTEQLDQKDILEEVTTEETTPVSVVDTPLPTEKVEESVVEVQEVEEGGEPSEKVEIDSEEVRDVEIEKDENRRNSLRKNEKKEDEGISNVPVKKEEREVRLEPDSFLDVNDESTLDKIHLLVEEEARKNEAKEMNVTEDFDNVSEERESYEEPLTKDEVETVILEKKNESVEKAKREETEMKEEVRASRESPKVSRARRNSRREKSPDHLESSNDAVEEMTEKKERKTSSSQESDKSETLSLKEKERRKEDEAKPEDDQDKTTIGKLADLSEAADDNSRPGDSDKESNNKTNRSDTPSTEDDKTSDVELQSTRSASTRRARSARDYSDSVPSSPASTQTITDEEKDYRAWKKSIMLVYGRIAAHKSASLFLRPITDDIAPGYSHMIYRPMDLFTMKKNIENGVIRTTAEFQRDVLLMFNNAIMYNKSGSHVHEMASAMQEEGVEILKEFVNTQLLLQAVGSDGSNIPSRRGTRTTEKRDLEGDRASTPKAGSSAGSASTNQGNAQLQAGKRKRSIVPEEGRTVSKRRKVC